MVSIEEIRNELSDVGEKLDLDMEIVEYIMQDRMYSNRFIIVNLESDVFLSDALGSPITSKTDFPSDISSNDCIFVISNSGEDAETIDLVRYAKSKKGLCLCYEF